MCEALNGDVGTILRTYRLSSRLLRLLASDRCIDSISADNRQEDSSLANLSCPTLGLKRRPAFLHAFFLHFSGRTIVHTSSLMLYGFQSIEGHTSAEQQGLGYVLHSCQASGGSDQQTTTWRSAEIGQLFNDISVSCLPQMLEVHRFHPQSCYSSSDQAR